MLAFANDTPVGTWKSIDDETGEAKSLIEISETDGVFSGRIVEILNPERADATCEKCQDQRKDQPILGMEILSGVTQSKDNLWKGGKILDPNKGKEYKVRFSLEDDGAQLKVRGYIGSPMLGRTQYWERVE